jgi:hypothetical protein
MLRRSVFALTCVLLASTAVPAEILPTLPLRELTIRADIVVLASPTDQIRPGRFRVHEVLKGSRPLAGVEIEAEGVVFLVSMREQLNWNQVDEAILFLRARSDNRLEIIESGARLHTRDGTVWWPLQPHDPGGYKVLPEAGLRWGTALSRVRADAAEATRLQLAAALADVSRRDRSLLDWVERHRHEFANGRDPVWMRFSPTIRSLGTDDVDLTDLNSTGWGDLQLLPFTRVLQGRVPADCWRAVKLYAALDQGATPPGAAAAFASPEGRAFLLAVARDDQQLDGHRARALRLLGDSSIVESVQLHQRERSELLDGLLPLLSDNNPGRRGLAARSVLRAAAHDSAATERAAIALRRAYKAEQPGPARNAFSEALYDLTGPQSWASHAGRPDGSLALLRDLGIHEDKLFFWLTLKSEPESVVREAPILLVERVSAKGAVAETKRIPVTLPASARSTMRWRGGLLYLEFSHADLRPGTWRLRVTGVSGPGKVPWESEPRTVDVIMKNVAPVQPEPSVFGSVLRTLTGSPPPPPRRVVMPDNHERRIVVLDGDPI